MAQWVKNPALRGAVAQVADMAQIPPAVAVVRLAAAALIQTLDWKLPDAGCLCGPKKTKK